MQIRLPAKLCGIDRLIVWAVQSISETPDKGVDKQTVWAKCLEIVRARGQSLSENKFETSIAGLIQEGWLKEMKNAIYLEKRCKEEASKNKERIQRPPARTSDITDTEIAVKIFDILIRCASDEWKFFDPRVNANGAIAREHLFSLSAVEGLDDKQSIRALGLLLRSDLVEIIPMTDPDIGHDLWRSKRTPMPTVIQKIINSIDSLPMDPQICNVINRLLQAAEEPLTDRRRQLPLEYQNACYQSFFDAYPPYGMLHGDLLTYLTRFFPEFEPPTTISNERWDRLIRVSFDVTLSDFRHEGLTSKAEKALQCLSCDWETYAREPLDTLCELVQKKSVDVADVVWNDKSPLFTGILFRVQCSGDMPEKETGVSEVVSTAKLDTNPFWDPDARELFFDGKSIKRFRNPAVNQIIVLNVFQEQDWPKRIDNPIPPKGPLEQKSRLRRTVGDLNKGLPPDSPIRFESDGTGEGVIWYRKADRNL